MECRPDWRHRGPLLRNRGLHPEHLYAAATALGGRRRLHPPPVPEPPVVERTRIAREHHRPGVGVEGVEELEMLFITHLLDIELTLTASGEHIGWVYVEQHVRLRIARDQVQRRPALNFRSLQSVHRLQ